MILLLILFGVLGAMLGSLANASAWRISAKTGDIYSSSKVKASKDDKYTRLHKRKSKKVVNGNISIWSGRSMCTDCHEVLRPVDLIPIISWILLRAKCRNCKNSIHWHYPVVEIVTSALFITSFYYWPWGHALTAYSMIGFALWLGAVTVGMIMSIYDFKYMILPTGLVYALGALAVGIMSVRSLDQGSVSIIGWSLVGGLVFGGIFYIIYAISNGGWIGGGDVRLGFALGILLGGWQKSLLAMALSSYIGTAVIILLIILRKYRKNMKLAFGPLLMIATFIVMLWGDYAIDWYMRISGIK